MRLPPGVTGTVVEVRVFNRHGIEKDERALAIERDEIVRLSKDKDDETNILDRNVLAKLKDTLIGCELAKGGSGLKKGTKLNSDNIEKIERVDWWNFVLTSDKKMKEIEAMKAQYDQSKDAIENRFIDKVEKLQRGDDMLPGVMLSLIHI